MLEDAMIAVLIQKPDAGHDDALVMGKRIAPLQAAHFAHDAVDQAGDAGFVKNGQQRGRADERRQLQAGIAVHQFQREHIGFADGLAPAEAVNSEIRASVEDKGKMRSIGGRLHIIAPVGSGNGSRWGLFF